MYVIQGPGFGNVWSAVVVSEHKTLRGAYETLREKSMGHRIYEYIYRSGNQGLTDDDVAVLRLIDPELEIGPDHFRFAKFNWLKM